MPLSTTDATIVVPCSMQARVGFSRGDLSSVFGRLAIQPRQACANQVGYESAVAIAQAARAIDGCYPGLPKRHIRMLRSFVERTIRHARLVIATAGPRDTREGLRRHGELQMLLDHSVRILRREVVRAMRHEQLELRWPTGETALPNKRSLKGTKSGLTSFVNRVCYAVTRELGLFEYPLLPLAPKAHPSDKLTFSHDPISLVIRWDDQFGWIVESIPEVGSSEATTEVEEGRMAEHGKKLEGEESQTFEIDENCGDEIEEDDCEDDITREEPMSDLSMDDGMEGWASKR